MENWKDVVGYEGLYLISDSGIVIGPIKKLKPGKASHGYLTVALCKNKVQKSTCIHRILAEAFIPNPNNYRCINHKDGNKLNNDLSNLEWVSHGTNNKHAYDTGLKKPSRKVDTNQVSEMRMLYHFGGFKVCYLAKKYKVNHATVSDIVNFKTRLHG